METPNEEHDKHQDNTGDETNGADRETKQRKREPKPGGGESEGIATETAGGDVGKSPPPLFETMCIGDERHQYTAADVNKKCPICGAPANMDLMVPIDPAPFADIADGADLWYEATASIERTFLYLAGAVGAVWFEKYFKKAHKLVIGLWLWRFLRGLQPESWWSTKRIKGWQTLHVVLSQWELAKTAKKMAKLAKELADVAAQQKASNAHFNDEKERIGNKLAELSAAVREGELRKVAIETVYDYRMGICTQVRTDTGEILNERPLTGEERQGEMRL